MSQEFATFILMNNYFHDVATAMLLACSVMLWIMLKHLGQEQDTVLTNYAIALYRGVTLMYWFSVLWIVASGIVRVATFYDFEWFNTTQKHFEAGLLAKYAIAIVMMIAGMVFWIRLSRAMRERLRQ